MKIQSLSVVVPAPGCINSCRFCVACMNNDSILYKNQMDQNLPFYDLYFKDYLKRLKYARDVGVNTVMLTGNCEPQQNKTFLKDFGIMMMLMEKPFRNLEMQTTGRLLDQNYLRFLRNHVGVNTISLSVSSFDDYTNCFIIDEKTKGIFIELEHLCQEIKKYDFNLRLSLNLSKELCLIDPAYIIEFCKNTFHADQVTFRVLYSTEKQTAQDEWINKHGLNPEEIMHIRNYIKTNSLLISLLPFGQVQYEINGMSIVLDDDCMGKQVKEDIKYLILRPDCKLYSKWDSKASLVF